MFLGKHVSFVPYYNCINVISAYAKVYDYLWRNILPKSSSVALIAIQAKVPPLLVDCMLQKQLFYSRLYSFKKRGLAGESLQLDCPVSCARGKKGK